MIAVINVSVNCNKMLKHKYCRAKGNFYAPILKKKYVLFDYLRRAISDVHKLCLLSDVNKKYLIFIKLVVLCFSVCV